MTNTDTTLKPCPFCGGDAHIGTVRYSRPLDDVRWSEDDAPVTEAFYGHCARCSAGHRNSIAGGYRTEAQAIAAWNQREKPAVPDVREALTEAETWLRECSAWLLSTDLDMTCPMETDPLDIADKLAALTPQSPRACCEAERERCAKIAEDRISAFDTLGDRGISSDYIAGHEAGQDEAADDIATAIRGADQ